MHSSWNKLAAQEAFKTVDYGFEGFFYFYGYFHRGSLV